MYVYYNMHLTVFSQLIKSLAIESYFTLVHIYVPKLSARSRHDMDFSVS